MKQSKIFLESEGNAWLKRNKDRLTAKDDPILAAIKTYGIKPGGSLEIGCSNGWRVKELEKLGFDAWGVDPCANPLNKKILCRTADDTGMKNSFFDLVIYGWCLYLCDPEDYFKIAMEGDRILNDGGYLIIYDFHSDHTYKTPYKHKSGLFSHHYGFWKLWHRHPAYTLYGRTFQDETSVTILKKNLKNAFPVEK